MLKINGFENRYPQNHTYLKGTVLQKSLLEALSIEKMNCTNGDE
ncbi:MAG: hypothetical protein ABFS16_08555 [Bacteroidota bacterium]